MEGLGERYQVLSYKSYNPRDLICHIHPLDNLNLQKIRPKCRVVYELVLHYTRKELFGLCRRSSIIALRETPELLGPSITECNNKHTNYCLDLWVQSQINADGREVLNLESRSSLVKRSANG
jgi:hypothetical protein